MAGVTPTTVGEILRSHSAKALAETLETIAKASAPAAPEANAADAVSVPAAVTEKAAPAYQIYKADAESGVVYVFSSAAGITDKDGDTIDRADLIKASQDFCASAERGFNANHGQDHYDLSKAELVESIVGAPILKSGRTLTLGEELPKSDEDPVIGMNIEKGKETHALIGVRLNNADAFEVAKKGGLIGASIEASCIKTEVKNDG